MKEFSITELASIINASLPDAELGVFSGVSIDSRTVKPGDCFFSIVGEHFDGHDYVSKALSNGAACAVVSRDVAGENVLKVDDTVKALGDFAAEYRKVCGFKVVAITGSVGKTTTRQITAHALSGRFKVTQSPENFNNNIGLPLTLLSARADDDFVVAELGSNNSGEISYLTAIAEPDIAVVTNAYPAHLEGFGDIEAVINEKLSICEGLRDGGCFLINADVESLADKCKAMGREFKTFGKKVGSNIRVTDISFDHQSTEFVIDGEKIHLPLPGRGNVENAAAAWAICREFGMAIKDFAVAMGTLPAVSMRVEMIEAGTVTIIDDCYNANPASMKNSLELLADLGSQQNRRRVFICGDMGELGAEAKQFHEQLGAEIAKAKVELLVTVGGLAAVAGQAAKQGANGNMEIKNFEDTISACSKLEKFVEDADIVLVKGSRSVKLESAVEKLKELFYVERV